MNKPDNKPNIESTFVPKEGQPRFLSGDKRLSGCPSLVFKNKDEMVQSFQKLWKQKYGESLDKETALTKGLELIKFIQYMNPELNQ